MLVQNGTVMYITTKETDFNHKGTNRCEPQESSQNPTIWSAMCRFKHTRMSIRKTNHTKNGSAIIFLQQDFCCTFVKLPPSSPISNGDLSVCRTVSVQAEQLNNAKLTTGYRLFGG